MQISNIHTLATLGSNRTSGCNQVSSFIFLIIGILFLHSVRLPAQDIKFERFSQEKGLFQSNITTIFQDSRGLIWVGTSDGLSRYDGYEFTIFRFDPMDERSISGNYIHSIYEDRFGYLWVRTSGGGINMFDPGTRTFKHFYHDANDPFSLSNDNISCLLEDRKGNFWLGSNGGGLNLFIREKGTFRHCRNSAASPQSLNNNFVSDLQEDKNGDIWVGTNGGGLNKFTPPDSLKLSKMRQSSPTSPALNDIRFIHYYAAGETYPPDVFSFADSLTRSKQAIASVLQPENYQESTHDFTITTASEVLVVAIGDGNAYGMTDYGWIERVPFGSKVWQMRYENSTHAGGATRNRVLMEVMTLQPGNYQLRYRSDHEHSHNNWVGNPPEYASLWGIQLFLLPKSKAAPLSMRLRQKIVPNSLSHNWITDLETDPDGNLWIGTADGISKLNLDALMDESEQFSTFKHHPGQDNSLNHSYIQRIYRGKDGGNFLWVLTPAAGLNQIDYRTGKNIRYAPAGNIPREDNLLLSDGQISGLLLDRYNHLWVGTANAGLNCFSPAVPDSSGKPKFNPITYFRHDPGNPNSLSNDGITSLFEDRSGTIWVGTSRGGLNQLNQRQSKFQHFTHQPENSQSLSHKVITAVYEDWQGVIWVGTAGGGLNKLVRNPNAEDKFVFTHFKHSPGRNDGLSHNFISAIYEDKVRNLWIGTYGNGLSKVLDREDGKFAHYRYDPFNNRTITGNFINTIYEDQFGQLWIGTNSGLNKFDRFTEKFTQYRHMPGDPKSLSNNEIWSIYEDSYSHGKTLWIGTRAGGLNKFDRKNEEFIRYMRDFDDPHSLNNPAILSIHQDNAGALWFGTYSGGLNKFNRETEKFTFFTERDGLSNNMIYGILEDRKGSLWLSTNNGLSQFNLINETFKNYDVYDGLQANEFNAGAHIVSYNGEMIFGGVNGITVFHPDSISENSVPPPIVFNAFSIYGENKDTLLTQAVFSDEPLQLKHNQNFISFEFAAIDYLNPGKVNYAYKLEGFNEEWIECGTRRFISFTNLDPGEYVFRVKAANSDGIWNENGAAVYLEIDPPFWKTWWFIAFASLFLLAVTIFIQRSWVQSKVRRALELEQVRSQENERVRAKAAHDFHDELGHQLTKISLFSEILKRSMGDTRPELTDYISRIGDTSKSLSNGMRDFIWTLNPEKDSLHEVLVRLKDFGDHLFDKTGVSFRVDGIAPEMEAITLTTDWRRHLTLLFKEAMNNTLKHAQCKNVILDVSLKGKHLEVVLADDGIGLPEEHYTNNGKAGQNGQKFYYAKSSSGNGLNNMKFRTQQIDGNIEFLPNDKKGMLIRFSGELPES